MNAASLVTLFERNHRALRLTMDGITDADARRRHEGGGHAASWILAHLLLSRRDLLALLGDEAFDLPFHESVYRRGASDHYLAGDLAPLNSLIEAFEASQVRITRRLGVLTDADLLRVAGGEPTLADAVLGIHFHESWHLGQLGLMRRWLGLDGAIA